MLNKWVTVAKDDTNYIVMFKSLNPHVEERRITITGRALASVAFQNLQLAWLQDEYWDAIAYTEVQHINKR